MTADLHAETKKTENTPASSQVSSPTSIQQKETIVSALNRDQLENAGGLTGQDAQPDVVTSSQQKETILNATSQAALQQAGQ